MMIKLQSSYDRIMRSHRAKVYTPAPPKKIRQRREDSEYDFPF